MQLDSFSILVLVSQMNEHVFGSLKQNQIKNKYKVAEFGRYAIWDTTAPFIRFLAFKLLSSCSCLPD